MRETEYNQFDGFQIRCANNLAHRIDLSISFSARTDIECGEIIQHGSEN